MVSKTRRKEQKARKKQKKKLQQRKRIAKPGKMSPETPQGNAVLRRRLDKQKPRAWEGELAEDVAVFDDTVLASLSPERAGHVSAVRQALQHASELRGEDALGCLSVISRNSPLSEWRLFIRGLVPWLNNQVTVAYDAWKRLDPERRPGRIATAMMSAIRNDLEQISVDGTDSQPAASKPASWPSPLDKKLLYHAKLLRRLCFDRAAIRIAKAELQKPEEAQELLLGPRRIEWLADFAHEFRATEPRLIANLEQRALIRAYCQNYEDLFEMATAAFSGPRHDRHNRLLRFFYFSRFHDDSSQREADENLKTYLSQDLPQNEELSKPVRGAITSQIFLNEAIELMQPKGEGMLALVFEGSEDTKAIKNNLQNAVRAYPANRAAYTTHVHWLESRLDDDRLTKPRRAPLLRQLTKVMESWSRALPDDVEPRLWLVDHLLEEEQLDAAKPHVDWLAASRQDDPRVRATPWKWHLLEAMRLSRRKAWLSEVPSRLQEAASLWPTWLSRQWLPYLEAACALRAGKTAEFERQRQEICEQSGIVRDCLVDACMTLSAAQRMRLPAADLKALREPVDQAVKHVDRLADEELILAGGFFWDLQRTRLLYPAYRMHGGKFAKELWTRLRESSTSRLQQIDEASLAVAILWCSEHRFFGNGYLPKLPHWFMDPPFQHHPMFVAASVNALLKIDSYWIDEKYRDHGRLLCEVARSERDPYYRYWFAALASELEELSNRRSLGTANYPFDLFRNMFQDDDSDDLPDFGF